MRARRGERGLFGRGAATALLALASILYAALSGPAALRAAAPAFDPAAFICAAHPDPAGVPDQDKAPAGSHDLCCTLLCAAGGIPPPALPPAAGPTVPPPARLGPALALPADGCPDLRRRCTRHGARAPPVPA